MTNYMNGHGIMAHTALLNSRLWDATGPAILGASAVFCGPLLAWAIFIHRFPFDLPASDLSIALGWMIGTLSVCIGMIPVIEYERAAADVRRHIRAMEAETKRLGRGWAQS